MSSVVMDIKMDKKGVLWVATNIGVLSYKDGKVTKYTTENSPLTSNYVQKVYIDENNQKWFITGTGKKEGITPKGIVTYLEPNYDTYKDWTVYNTFTHGIDNVNICRDFAQDKQGNIWLLNLAEGLYKIKGNDLETVKMPKASGAFGRTYWKMAIKANDIYIATTPYLLKYDGSSFKVFDDIDKKKLGKGVGNIVVDNQGVWWLSSKLGLSKFDGQEWELFHKKNSDLPTNSIGNIFLDSKNNLWLTTGKGLLKYDGTNWKLFNKKNSQLPRNSVSSICEASDGTIWLGMGYGGLVKYNGSDFEHIKADYSINSISIDKNNHIWIGTNGKGLVRYDGSKFIRYTEKDSPIYNPKIEKVKVIGNEVWVSVTAPRTRSTSLGTTTTETPEPTEEEKINQKIKKFIPQTYVVKYKIK